MKVETRDFGKYLILAFLVVTFHLGLLTFLHGLAREVDPETSAGRSKRRAVKEPLGPLVLGNGKNKPVQGVNIMYAAPDQEKYGYSKAGQKGFRRKSQRSKFHKASLAGGGVYPDSEIQVSDPNAAYIFDPLDVPSSSRESAQKAKSPADDGDEYYKLLREVNLIQEKTKAKAVPNSMQATSGLAAYYKAGDTKADDGKRDYGKTTSLPDWVYDAMDGKSDDSSHVLSDVGTEVVLEEQRHEPETPREDPDSLEEDSLESKMIDAQKPTPDKVIDTDKPTPHIRKKKRRKRPPTFDLFPFDLDNTTPFTTSNRNKKPPEADRGLTFDDVAEQEPEVDNSDQESSNKKNGKPYYPDVESRLAALQEQYGTIEGRSSDRRSRRQRANPNAIDYRGGDPYDYYSNYDGSEYGNRRSPRRNSRGSSRRGQGRSGFGSSRSRKPDYRSRSPDYRSRNDYGDYDDYGGRGSGYDDSYGDDYGDYDVDYNGDYVDMGGEEVVKAYDAYNDYETGNSIPRSPSSRYRKDRRDKPRRRRLKEEKEPIQPPKQVPVTLPTARPPPVPPPQLQLQPQIPRQLKIVPGPPRVPDTLYTEPRRPPLRQHPGHPVLAAKSASLGDKQPQVNIIVNSPAPAPQPSGRQPPGNLPKMVPRLGMLPLPSQQALHMARAVQAMRAVNRLSNLNSPQSFQQFSIPLQPKSPAHSAMTSFFPFETLQQYTPQQSQSPYGSYNQIAPPPPPPPHPPPSSTSFLMPGFGEVPGMQSYGEAPSMMSVVYGREGNDPPDGDYGLPYLKAMRDVINDLTNDAKPRAKPPVRVLPPPPPPTPHSPPQLPFKPQQTIAHLNQRHHLPHPPAVPQPVPWWIHP